MTTGILLAEQLCQLQIHFCRQFDYSAQNMVTEILYVQFFTSFSYGEALIGFYKYLAN